ncbi:MAG TPA: 5'-nucleotidase C-terminal domain-containing protein [Thermoanaerobaculia bacterium]
MKRALPLVLLLAAACSSLPRSSEPVHVVIVGTTDVHGWYNGHVEVPEGGGEGVLIGGLASFAGHVEALRAAHGGRVIVVDAGDLFQGTIESNMFEGEPMVRGYNAIGYAAMAIGNHEFDFGPVGPEPLARGANEDSLGALKRNAGLARFPFLSANMVEKSSGRTPSWARPYTIVSKGGARIGIIGLTTPDTPNVTMAVNVASLEFTDPVAATIAAARELRQRGVDAIVAVAHMGGRCRDTSDPHLLDSCDPSQEAMQILEALPAGTIDAWFGGHTHARMAHFVNGVAVAQAAPYSREFSTIDLWIEPKNDRVVRKEIREHTMICSFVYSGTEHCQPSKAPAGARLEPRTFSGMTIRPDARVAAAMEPYLRRVALKRDEMLGVTAAANFPRSYWNESPLGNLVADALREATGAEVALMNSGGIRADLPAGPLTYGDVYAVSPFDNYPTMVVMTGEQLTQILGAMSGGARGILQVSGVRYTIDHAKETDVPATSRNRVVSVTLSDGSPLDPAKYYAVVMPDFVAAGGDGTGDVMGSIPAHRIQIFYAKPIRDVLIEVLRKRTTPLTPALDGRITVLNPAP